MIVTDEKIVTQTAGVCSKRNQKGGKPLVFPWRTLTVKHPLSLLCSLAFSSLGFTLPSVNPVVPKRRLCTLWEPGIALNRHETLTMVLNRFSMTQFWVGLSFWFYTGRKEFWGPSLKSVSQSEGKTLDLFCTLCHILWFNSLNREFSSAVSVNSLDLEFFFFLNELLINWCTCSFVLFEESCSESIVKLLNGSHQFSNCPRINIKFLSSRSHKQINLSLLMK